ncbi:BppU family phage baseplate upper protein [Lactobacillus johnsonii]|nr:BppU family phage baseplate upper protein [Lactobacillus johnsonii]
MTSVNHGEPYFLKADISKAGQSRTSINDYIKMRVADNGKILPVQWYDQGRVMNVNGMIPFIEGAVGQWHTDDDDNIVMAPDADYRDWQGSAANTRDGGWADYILTDQMFTQKGIFYGKIGLMDGNGRRLTSIDIWFRVLGDDVMFGLTGKYYSDKIEKFIKQMQAKGDKAIDDIYERYKGKAQNAENELDSINKNFGTINAALKSVGLSTAALQNQIDSENLESVPNHNADIYLLKQDIVNRFGQLKHPTQVFDSLAQIQAKYPNGADGSMLATDNGHIYVYNWNTNLWKDFGVFQAQGLPPEITETLNKSVKGYKILLKDIDPPYDNLDTLPANQVVTYASPRILIKST